MKLIILPNNVKNWFSALISPLVNLFIRMNLHPNVFTSLSLILGAVSGLLYGMGSLRFGGLVLFASGIFDMIDGRVARESNRVTKFGALFDSTLDRYAEVFVFFGLAYYFVEIKPEHMWVSIVVSVALAGSIMVSYVRARAEGLGFACKVGILQRPERIVLLGFGSIVQEWILISALILIAVLANFTAIQRLYHIWVAENGKKSEKVPVEMAHE